MGARRDKTAWLRGWEALASAPVLAAFAAWLAVWLGTVGQLAAQDPALAWPARGLMLLFLAGFLASASCEHPGDRWRGDLGFVVQLAAFFGLVLLGRSGAVGILLVLFAATFTLRFPARLELAVFAAANAALAALMVLHWGISPANAAMNMLAWVGFQAFAALLMRYARRAEEMADALRVVNADLLATRSLLSETARDQERLRLSRELHDVAGHHLTALKLNLRLLERVPEAAARPELATSAQLVDELLTDLRGLVRQLRMADGMDLEAALRRLAEPLPRPRVELSIAPEARVPRAEQAEALLRAAQEGLTNAARHGGARRAWLRLEADAGRVLLRLEDDGRVRWPLTPGNGLAGMRERLEALGGSLRLDRSSAGGLRLEAELPLGGGS